jgi:cell wall assembly regulator SMI1
MTNQSVLGITNLNHRSPAQWDQIEAAERELGRRLPEDYRSFLRESNGLEGFVGAEAYLILWSIQEIAQLNSGYATTEFAPGLVLIGTNGGNTGYGFIDNQSNVRYVQVSLIPMDDVNIVGNMLFDLVKYLQRCDSENKNYYQEKDMREF